MTSMIFAAPYRPPTPPRSHWQGLRPRWTGWDGSEWPFLPSSGVFLMRNGVRGLTMPPFSRYASTAASVDGSRHRGSRASEREVFWPLSVYSDAGSQGWIDLDRAFWRTMNPERPGVWTVEQPSGEIRSLTCRFVDDGDFALANDPTWLGWANYGVTLVAEDPFWRGAPILRTWQAGVPRNFFGESGGPPFHISSSSTLGGARVTNPGDEATRPVWLVYGPTETAEVGVGGRVVQVPFPLAEGEVLVIDTRPTAQSAVVMGAPTSTSEAGELVRYVEVEEAMGATVDVTRDLGDATAFAAVPAGKSVDLSVSMVGTGRVQMLLTPLWHRAW